MWVFDFLLSVGLGKSFQSWWVKPVLSGGPVLHGKYIHLHKLHVLLKSIHPTPALSSDPEDLCIVQTHTLSFRGSSLFDGVFLGTRKLVSTWR